MSRNKNKKIKPGFKMYTLSVLFFQFLIPHYKLKYLVFDGSSAKIKSKHDTNTMKIQLLTFKLCKGPLTYRFFPQITSY